MVYRWPAVYFSTQVPFFVKVSFSEFWRLFLCVLDFSKFSGLFSTCFEISVWNLVYTCSMWCYTSSSSFIPIGTLWSTLQPKIGQSHLSAFMALKSYRGLRFGTHTYIVSVLILTDFRHGWAIFGPLADKNTWKGVLLELPASEKFSGLFLYMLWDISLKLGIYMQ